jgi:hypothetical protein
MIVLNEQTEHLLDKQNLLLYHPTTFEPKEISVKRWKIRLEKVRIYTTTLGEIEVSEYTQMPTNFGYLKSRQIGYPDKIIKLLTKDQFKPIIKVRTPKIEALTIHPILEDQRYFYNYNNILVRRLVMADRME